MEYRKEVGTKEQTVQEIHEAGIRQDKIAPADVEAMPPLEESQKATLKKALTDYGLLS